ncbi:hypothetical protein [Candidatus Thiodictyon syntrophicum]|nr:hypothetical protein [Candidatus Thiodictyon syntrophicum]
MRYGLAIFWLVPLAHHLPQARGLGDAVGMVVLVSVVTGLLALLIGLAGIIGDALTRWKPR